MQTTRRSVLGAIAAGLVTSPMLPRLATAQQGVIRMVIPWAPGGSTDIIGRHFADAWRRHLGQTVVVENRSGASGTIGHAAVASSTPDGRTVLMATNSTYAIAPSLYRNIPYVHDDAFAPVTLMARSPVMLCVNARVPAQDVLALIALAKSKPSELNMGIGGSGTTSHLASEMFMAHSDTQFTLVSYRGSGQTVQAIHSGEIDAAFLSTTTIRPLLDAGSVRVLATTGTNRSVILPAVRPMAEAGLPRFEATTACALFVPKRTPAAEITRLHAAAAAALAEREVQEKFALEDVEVVGSGPTALAEHVREETARWAEVIRQRNITLN